MAEKVQERAAPAAKDPDADRKEFRRRAALEAFGAFVNRHGGFNREDMEAHVRKIWEYADCLVALENAPPLPPQQEFNILDLAARRTQPAQPAPRTTHPADEWAVYDGDRRVRGFVGREEADFYAASRPGAKVVQVGGPAAEVGRVADPAAV